MNGRIAQRKNLHKQLKTMLMVTKKQSLQYILRFVLHLMIMQIE